MWCIGVALMAQAPQRMSYQSVVRDADDNLITGTVIGMQISILQGSADGMAVYAETQTPESNANGLVSIEIGAGNTTDDFSAIHWEEGPYYLKIEIDIDGGTNYGITSISRILSVPYALHAAHAETFTGYEQLLERIKALEDALDNGGPGVGTVTDIDGNVYTTVIINNREWMAENLRVTRYSNGDLIPSGLSNTEWDSATEGAYAVYDHNATEASGIDSPQEMVRAYGKLYNWYAVGDNRGLCPEGWSIPSDDDWTQLIDFATGRGFPNEQGHPGGVGNALKSCLQVNSPFAGCDTYVHPRWNPHNTHHGLDEFGFSALPGGLRMPAGTFSVLGFLHGWWTSTETSDDGAWNQNLRADGGHIYRVNYHKLWGFGVRCIRDSQ